jgi:putative ABC transport system permease protein
MLSVLNDVRLAARALRKAPGFSLGAIATLAVGIGATTAVFSVVNGILLRPLPYPESERLVAVFERDVRTGEGQASMAFPTWEGWSERQQVFESIAAYAPTDRTLDFGEGAERLPGSVVSSRFFPTLAVQPLLGRGFRAEEDVPGSGGVILLSYGLWQSRFGGDRGVLGRPLTVDGRPYAVVGVMPRGFAFPESQGAYWIPMADACRDPRTFYLQLVGRLGKGVAVPTARAQAATLRRVETDPVQPAATYQLAFRPLKDLVVGDAGSVLVLFSVAVAGVLLLACTNVVILLSSRSAARLKEMAIRAALGAGRGRLARQLLTESTVLGLVGATVGSGLAVFLTRGLLWLDPRAFPRQTEIGVDLGALGFSLALALVVGGLVGILPALHSSRSGLSYGLREGGRSIGSGATGGRLRDGLVVCQVALALVLLVASGVLINSFARLWTNPTGFDAEDVLTVKLALPSVEASSPGARGSGRYETHDQRLAYYRELSEKLRSVPGIRSVALISFLPFSGSYSQRRLRIEGIDAGIDPGKTTGSLIVSPEFFTTMRVPVLRGRALDPGDAKGAPGVVVIDETFARRHLPDQDPVGRRLRLREDGEWLTIVGVVGATRQRRLRQDHVPQAYLPYAQSEAYGPPPDMGLLVRTRSEPRTLVATVRSAVASIDAGVPVVSTRTMEERVWSSIAGERFVGSVVSFFGLAALLLAIVGVYSVVSYAVSQRTREIGIRMALGAPRQWIVADVVRKGLAPAGIGLGVGFAGAYAAAGALESQLFGIGARDLPTFALALALLAGAALLASGLPALRASRVDPTIALRAE